MADARTTVVVVEAAISDVESVRATSLVVEAIIPDASSARATNLVIEVMYPDPPADDQFIGWGIPIGI